MTKYIIFLFCSGILITANSTLSSDKTSNIAGKFKLSPKAGVEFKANTCLFQACKFLTQAKTFKFKATVTRDVLLYDGVRVQYGGVSNITIKRPHYLKAIYTGDEKSRKSFFNGKQLTIYSEKHATYAQVKVQGTIDNAIDTAYNSFGFSIPLADLVYSDPYAVLIENVDKGYFIGQHRIAGTLCNHLAFKQDIIDWQVWIEAGKRPLVRKIVITYKTEPGFPEYEAELSNWQFDIPLKNTEFEFTPPSGVERIDFMPTKQAYGEKQGEE